MPKKPIRTLPHRFMRAWPALFFPVTAILAQESLLPHQATAPIHNAGFEQVEQRRADDDRIKPILAAGWKIDPGAYPWRWQLNPAVPGALQVITGTSHTGERCVKLDGNGHLYYIVGAIDPDKTYRIRVWAKGEGKLRLFAYLYDARTCIGQQDLLGPTALTPEWKAYTAELRIAKPGVVAVNPGMAAAGPACYLDDFAFGVAE